MSVDIASLALKIDATEVDAAVKSLGNLSAAGERASASSGKMAGGYSGLDAATKKMAGSNRAAAVDTAKLDASLTALLTKINPSYAAVQNLDKGTDLLSQGLKAGLISNQQYASSIHLLQTAFIGANAETSKMVHVSQRSAQSMASLGRALASGNFAAAPFMLGRIAMGLSPVALAVGGVTAVLGVGAYAWYKWGDSAKEAITKAKEARAISETALAESTKGVTLTDMEKRAVIQKKIADATYEEAAAVKRRDEGSGGRASIDIGADVINRRKILVNLQRESNQLEKEIAKTAADAAKTASAPADKAAEEKRKFIAQMQRESDIYGLTAGQIKVQDAALMGMNSTQQETVRILADEADARAKAEKDATALAKANEKIAASMEKMQDFLSPENAANFGNELAGAFGKAGDAIQNMANAYRDYGKVQEENANAQRVLNAASKSGIDVSIEQAKLAQKNSMDQVGAYGDMAGAAKGFFKEGSDGYQTMQQVEQVYRAFQFAASVASMAQAAAETTVIVATDGTKTASGMVAGAARMFSQSGWLGFAGVAAMVALIASMGGKSKGGGGAPTPGSFEAKVSNKGTGSVLGDAEAKSESIKNSLDKLISLDMPHLVNSSKMVRLLTSINTAISGTTSAIVRSGSGISTGGGFSGGTTDLGGSRGLAGAVGSALQSIPILGGLGLGAIGKYLGGSTKSTSSLASAGLTFGNQTVGAAMEGIDAQQFATTRTDTVKKRAFKKTKRSTSYSTEFSELDVDVKEGLEDIISGMFDAVSSAALSLGTSPEQVAKLKDMELELGKVDLKGKTGKEIEEIMGAVFSKMGDSMAKFIIPGVERFQFVGEGLFETLMRVASWNEYANDTFAKLGLSVGRTGDAAIDANIAIIDLFGGIENASEAIGTYTDKFYSDTEKQAMAMGSLDKQFAAMGISTPASIAAFRQVVEGIDLSTEAGQEMFVSMMNISGAFASASEGADELAKKLGDLLNKDNFSSLYEYTRAVGRSAGGEIPGFASGGTHMGGLRIVGENGPELEMTGASRIMSNSDLMSRFGKGSGNDALVAEIQALRAEVSQLRSDNQAAQVAIAMNTNRSAKILERFDGNGMPAEREL